MSNEKIVDSLFDNNLETFRNEVRAALYVKAGEYMNSAKQSVANSIFNSGENVQEAKKANKDYDGDGKVETSTDEWKGSRDKAIKASMAKRKKD
jgi:hypothetical protein